MKKKWWIILLIVLVLILTIPIPGGRYRDGGTKEYKALAYRIVVWNRLTGDGPVWHKTCVYWFPESLKSIDELWELTYDQNTKETSPSET